MAAVEHAHSTACRNCGQHLTGPYCAACGQAEHDGHSPTVAHFFHDLIHETLHVDGKLFGTLKALFFQPGKLTQEYWQGRVVSWIRPIRIFLVVVALHLVASKGVGPLNLQLKLSRSPSGDLSINISSGKQFFTRSANYTPVEEEEREAFFVKFEKAYLKIRYFSVVLFSFLAYLLYRKQQPSFVSHLIGGLHFYSFWYALGMLASIPARYDPIWNGLSLLSAVYLALALRRLFVEPWYWRAVKVTTLFLFVLLIELGLGYFAVSIANGSVSLSGNH